MACSGCGQKAKRPADVKTVDKPTFIPTTEKIKPATVLPLAEKSESDKRVKLRYLGGGYSTRGQGCRSCGGTGTKYKFVSSERIQFVSEDSPDNWFNMLVTVGHDYYVTEKQAEYMLTLTYTSKAGRIVNKFERVG